MKFKITAFFFIATFFFHHASAQVDERLIGKWILIKITDDQQTMTPPNSVSYYLAISKSTFHYSLGVNNCDLYEVKTIKNSIIIGSPGLCTEACCDEKLWKYSNRINYQGNYRFKNKEKILVISNQSGKLYLKRE